MAIQEEGVCGPGERLIGNKCVPFNAPAGQADTQYYKQYLQDLPGYQTPGQGTYTGMGTAGFHPNYGVPGKSQSARVLSTPLQTDFSNLNLTGVPEYAGGPSGLSEGVSGYAGGRSGYDAGDVASGYRVRETPKRMDAPFSMGDPYAQGGSLWNVGRLMENRVDPYGGIDPTLLYDLRRNAAGGADLPPGYTAGLGRTAPSEGYTSVKDLLGASGMGGAPGGGIPGKGGGELLNLGGLLGGGAPVTGGAPGGGLAGGTSKGAVGGAKKGGGGAKKGGRSSSGRAKKPGSGLGIGAGGGSAGGGS
ncbi:hypothetical protein KAW18_01335 [candidate division WOR-3 bacterium]|nr:hypothetical protein [candidate division WOR-3 bacterium]